MIVLGLSCFYHDAAAALVRDGQLVAAAEEERFNRQKHYSDFPELAVEYCLKEAGITIDQVDYIGFYEKPIAKFDRILETILAQWPRSFQAWHKSMPIWMDTKLHIASEIRKKLGVDKDVLYCQHHLAHAASAFLVSGFDTAAIISADGVGEWTTTAWGVGRGTNLEFHKEIRFPHSIGLLFSAVTAYLGFKVNDAEWKVMGLAPYGQPRYVDKFREVVDIKDDGSFRLNMKYFSYLHSTTRTFSPSWEKLFGRPSRSKESELDEFHADIAHSGQKIVEEIIVKMATHVHTVTGLDEVCLAGGVGLNCVANWRILQESGFKNMFIQPAAGDSGGALGTAFYIYNSVLKKPRTYVMKHALVGPSFSDAEIAEMLQRNHAPHLAIDDEDELITRTAQLLAEGKVIGWFQGRMEFGPPRARGAVAARGSSKPEDEGHHQREGEVPRGIPAVRPGRAQGARARVFRDAEGDGCSLHAARAEGPSGETIGDPGRDTSRRHRACSDRHGGHQPAVLSADQEVWPAHRCAGAHQHLVQCTRRAHRVHAAGQLQHVCEYGNRRARHRQVSRDDQGGRSGLRRRDAPQCRP